MPFIVRQHLGLAYQLLLGALIEAQILATHRQLAVSLYLMLLCFYGGAETDSSSSATIQLFNRHLYRRQILPRNRLPVRALCLCFHGRNIYTRRDAVQTQIMEIPRPNPALRIIITGRQPVHYRSTQPHHTMPGTKAPSIACLTRPSRKCCLCRLFARRRGTLRCSSRFGA